MEKYPYFIYPVINDLRQYEAAASLSPEDAAKAERLREIIASNVGDYRALVALIGEMRKDVADFCAQGADTHSTEDTIESFIAKFGNPDSLSSEYPFFEIESPVSEESEPSDEENFDSLFEKAKAMVKNGDYQGGLAIMESIYLNNPKKSIYFADQIRFVRKMMLNDRKIKK